MHNSIAYVEQLHGRTVWISDVFTCLIALPSVCRDGLQILRIHIVYFVIRKRCPESHYPTKYPSSHHPTVAFHVDRFSALDTANKKLPVQSEEQMWHSGLESYLRIRRSVFKSEQETIPNPTHVFISPRKIINKWMQEDNTNKLSCG